MHWNNATTAIVIHLGHPLFSYVQFRIFPFSVFFFVHFFFISRNGIGQWEYELRICIHDCFPFDVHNVILGRHIVPYSYLHHCYPSMNHVAPFMWVSPISHSLIWIFFSETSINAERNQRGNFVFEWFYFQNMIYITLIISVFGFPIPNFWKVLLPLCTSVRST